MVIIDDVIVLAAGVCAPARERREMGPADEHVEPVVMQTHPQSMPDQTRRYRVKDLAQREAARGRHVDNDLLVIAGAAIGKLPERGALDIDTLGVAGVLAPDDLVDEEPV